jgi:hypothetical protein
MREGRMVIQSSSELSESNGFFLRAGPEACLDGPTGAGFDVVVVVEDREGDAEALSVAGVNHTGSI